MVGQNHRSHMLVTPIVGARSVAIAVAGSIDSDLLAQSLALCISSEMAIAHSESQIGIG